MSLTDVWNVCRWALIIAVGVGRAAHLEASEPAIRDVNIRGLEIGAATTFIVDGDDLGATPTLLLPFAARQELKPGTTDKRATFEIVPDVGVIPGLYQVRVVADGGITLPIVVAVDRLSQRPVSKTIDQLPVSLHGTVAGPTVVETAFVGKAGQKVSIEVDAQRLGSKLRPIVHLAHAKGRQLAWTWGRPALYGDARLETVLPTDGEYTIAVHDAEYSPPGPGFFRLRVGQWSFVDQVYPPAVKKSEPQSLDFLGMVAPPHAEVLAVPHAGVVPVAWPGEGLWSGPRPFVIVSPHAEFVEQPSASGVQDLPAGAVGVSGRLATPYEEDRYRVPVVPGTKLRLEVWAERYGSALDAAIVVRNESGVVLVRAEDSATGLDPILDYTVPDKATAIVVSVADALGRGDPRAVYRLTIDPQNSETVKANFRLTTTTQRVSLPIGGHWVVPVLADRRGYAGGIELTAVNLPAGATTDGTTIPEGADGTLLSVACGDRRAMPATVEWVGRAGDGPAIPVSIIGHPLERVQPWLASEVGLAGSTANSAEFNVAWRGLASDAGLVPAGRLPLPIQLVRPMNDSPVRLTLLTSQPPILLNGQPDPNRALRAERPVELAANVVDGEMALLLPPELPAPVYDIAIQAELLSADKQRVLATAFAPVRRLPVRSPIVIQLAGPARIDATLDPQQGATVKIAGKIERREGLTGDVVVTLSGLPAGARADAVTVKADAAEFAVNLVLPANLSAGEIKGLKLSANGPAPGQPALRVRSRDLELVVVVSKAGSS